MNGPFLVCGIFLALQTSSRQVASFQKDKTALLVSKIFGLCCLIRSFCAYNSGTGAFLFILKLFSIVPSKTSHSAWVAVYYQYCILSLTCEIKISCCLLWCDPLALVTFLIERSATRNFQTARNRGSTFIIICGKGPIETRRPCSFCGSRLFFFLFSTPTVAQAAYLLDFRNTGAQRI